MYITKFKATFPSGDISEQIVDVNYSIENLKEFTIFFKEQDKIAIEVGKIFKEEQFGNGILIFEDSENKCLQTWHLKGLNPICINFGFPGYGDSNDPIEIKFQFESCCWK
ncbi:MAG: hypothetical protein WCG45_04155 [bacterium]